MKPRVLLSTGQFRLVRGVYGYISIEQLDGEDATHRSRWGPLKSNEPDRLRYVMQEIGATLHRRNRAAAKRRRKTPPKPEQEDTA